jgi:hypothetical protein
MALLFAVDGFFGRKSLVYGGFLEKRDAQDLQDFVQRMFHIQLLANDRHEYVNADRNPDLGLHRVRRSPVKRLDPQMLLDPSKEQLDLPTPSVNVRNCQCGQVEVVAQEHQPPARLGIAVDHATQGIGVEFRCLGAAEDDRLIAAHSGRLVHAPGRSSAEVEVALGTGHEECQAQLQAMESTEIEIRSVHHIESTGFDRQDVEDGDIVGLAVGNPHETRDISTQVDERVKFDSGLVASELSPGEQLQAEIDGRGIQRVGGMLQLNTEVVGLVQSPRPGDQNLSEVRVDPPVAVLVGIGKSAPSDDAAKAGVVEFFLKGVETSFDVSKALAIGQLSEGHAEKLIEAREVASPSVATIASDATVELASWKGVDQLRENVSIVEHEPSPGALRRVGNGSRLLWSSDRRQRISHLTPEIATRYTERSLR